MTLVFSYDECLGVSNTIRSLSYLRFQNVISKYVFAINRSWYIYNKLQSGNHGSIFTLIK